MGARTIPRTPSGDRARHPGKSPTGGERPPGFLRRHWWVWAVPGGLAALVVLALVVAYVRLSLPPADPLAHTTVLYDADGKLLTTLHGEQNRLSVPLSEVPREVRLAVLAAEDAGFYDHSGVSVSSIIRATWANLSRREIAQGGSTITQQYVRNAFSSVGRERTFSRKVKEILLAVKLEQRLTKHEILRRYLNTIYLGHGAYGIEAAARTYFGVPASRLDLGQAATLAGLIRAPEYYEPTKFPERARERRNWVLARMVGLGFLSVDEARRIAATPVETVAAERAARDVPAAYFVDHARRYLQQGYGVQATFTGGLRVKTSLVRAHQRAAEEAIATHLGERGDPAVALVAMRVDTGEITAMVGGRNFKRAKYNLATGAGTPGRQAGSAFKTFTLAAAVRAGISLESTYYGPARVTIDDPACATAGEAWSPANYSDSGAGTMDLVGATASSVNTIYAQLVVDVGPQKVAEAARALGIRSDLGDPAPCSITLGTKEVTPLEMTNAYATLASLGVRHAPTPVRWVRSPDGEVLERVTKKGKRVLEENEAAQIIHALQQVVCCGTGTAAAIGVPLFGKTGTTDDHADAWFCGASRLYAACVWIGYPEGRVPMEGVRGISVTGGSFPARIWHDFMAAIHEGLEVPGFPAPELTGQVISRVPAPSPAPSPTPEEEPEEEPGEGKEEREEPSPEPPPTPEEGDEGG